jgi:hypothetical protein
VVVVFGWHLNTWSSTKQHDDELLMVSSADDPIDLVEAESSSPSDSNPSSSCRFWCLWCNGRLINSSPSRQRRIYRRSSRSSPVVVHPRVATVLRVAGNRERIKCARLEASTAPSTGCLPSRTASHCMATCSLYWRIRLLNFLWSSNINKTLFPGLPASAVNLVLLCPQFLVQQVKGSRHLSQSLFGSFVFHETCN